MLKNVWYKIICIYIYLTNAFCWWLICSNGLSSPSDYQLLEEDSAWCSHYIHTHTIREWVIQFYTGLNKIVKYLHVYYIFCSQRPYFLIYDLKLSWWMNSVKLSWTSSHVRWWNGESTSSLMTGQRRFKKCLFAIQPPYAATCPRKLYWIIILSFQ